MGRLIAPLEDFDGPGAPSLAAKLGRLELFCDLSLPTLTILARHLARRCRRGVAVGPAISGRPPHRSRRAVLPHRAPTLDG